MNRVLYICFLVVVFTIGYANPISDKAFQAYQKKDYKQAITLYDQVLKEGSISDKLYYNLGNAYYKNNELGKAIYYYELAYKLNPKDEDISTNLKLASSKTIDKIDSKENFFISTIKSNVYSFLTTTEWAWLSIILLILCLGLLYGFVISSTNTLKRISFIGFFCLLILFITSFTLGSLALSAKHETSFGIVLTKETKILAEPDYTAKQKFTLHEGTKVSILKNDDEWVSIKLQNGNEGWIKASDIGLF